jgi:hypothetical protein
MKQKYVIERSDSGDDIVVKEYAELDKETLSLLCQESYSAADLTVAQQRGKTALIEAIRTNNMYPPGFYADQIADAIVGLMSSDASPSTELFFDDKALFVQEGGAGAVDMADDTDADDDDVVVDDLLDEEVGGGDEENEEIFTKLKSSFKVSDGDTGIVDEG